MATKKQADLVRHLLALSSSPFPAEAAAARKKANELIQKYGITEAELAPPKPRKCPGCPNCQPQRRRGVTIIYTTSGANFTFTSGNANGTTNTTF